MNIVSNIKATNAFTLIEIIIAISIIAILAGVGIPIYINLLDDAHKAHMDGIEAVLHSAVVLWASENYLVKGAIIYPNENVVTIEYMTDPGRMDDWTDLGGGVWKYDATGGTLTYRQFDGGLSYKITKVYSADD